MTANARRVSGAGASLDTARRRDGRAAAIVEFLIAK